MEELGVKRAYHSLKGAIHNHKVAVPCRYSRRLKRISRQGERYNTPNVKYFRRVKHFVIYFAGNGRKDGGEM